LKIRYAMISLKNSYYTKMTKMKNNDFSEQVIKFILTRNYDELGDLTVERVTYLLNVSRSYLYELFKKEKNFTPGEFLVMIKMVRSASLLEEDDVSPVKTIAQRMGFSTLDYFKKVFKAHFGTTPTRYRKYMKHK
jgi:AraC-like DNA-binding protein